MSRHADPGALTPAVITADDVRPLLRGVLHLAAAIAAPFGLVLLVVMADSPRGYVGASIFAATLIALYGTSATYHVVPWRQRHRRIVQRIDHAMIFALIAGTYTPFCLLALDGAWTASMLAVVWSLAGAGMLLKVLYPNTPRWLGVALYLALGWVGIVAAVELVQRLHPATIALLIFGGALYTVGAVIYAMRRPDPFPRVFGYHEVFHTLVIAGSAVHFGLIAGMLF